MRLIRFIKRLFKLLLSLALLAALALGYMRYIEPNWIEVSRMTVKAPGLEGQYKIVAFGDVHIGMGKDQKELERLVELINEEAPDGVFFLGDLFDDYSKYTGDPEACLNILSNIEARDKIAVRGNHDVGGGAQWVYPDMIASCGFALLENDRVVLDNGITVHGCAESLYFTPEVGPAGEGFDILLAHEPDVADSVIGVELQLSGHSHGGQIYIPFLLDRILPKGAEKYYRGLYEKPDGGLIYVNRGYGMSLAPLRLFSRPEITVVTIEGDENGKN